jgi:hypothetical protein
VGPELLWGAPMLLKRPKEWACGPRPQVRRVLSLRAAAAAAAAAERAVAAVDGAVGLAGRGPAGCDSAHRPASCVDLKAGLSLLCFRTTRMAPSTRRAPLS